MRLLLLSVLFLLLDPSVAYSEQRSSTTVFFLGSGNAETPWTLLVSEGVREKLEQSGLPYSYHIDHLEAARFDEQAQYALMFRYLRDKFTEQQPDIFIAAGPAAANFSLRYPELFERSERILIQSGKKHIVDATQIDAVIDHSLMIKEMSRLSSPNKVYIIGDSVQPSDQHRLNQVIAALGKQQLSYEVLENQALSELLEEVQKLPESSVIFYSPIYRRHLGKDLAPAYVLKELHRVARVPIFSSSDSTLGFGVVGGYMFSPRKLGLMAGEAASQLIKQAPVALTENGFGYVYDWGEITRWGFESLIDQDAEIRFRNPNLWQEHRTEIIVVATFALVLVFFSLVLLIINRKLIVAKASLYQERLLLEKRVEERTEELSKLHKHAEEIARIDFLTELPNRRAFFEQGEITQYEAERYQQSYAVMMIDIDLFKGINDRYGHPEGDKVIKIVASTIRAIKRKSDLAARIGGEEFAVVVTDLDKDQLLHLAERMRTEIASNPVYLTKEQINISVSIGVAEYEQADTGIDAVLRRADKALYRAKQTGRDRVVFYTSEPA